MKRDSPDTTPMARQLVVLQYAYLHTLFFWDDNEVHSFNPTLGGAEIRHTRMTMRTIHNSIYVLLLSRLSGVIAFAPPSGLCLGAAHDLMGVAAPVPSASDTPTLGFEATSNLLLSLVEESETIARQGLINWESPAEAFGGFVLLLYIGGSILAGVKYIVVDGWRPKF